LALFEKENCMSENYTKVAIMLHWLIGIAIIGMLGMGFLLEDIPNDYKFMAYQLHKSFGLSILVLSLFRLVWRLMHKAPPLPAHMKSWEVIVAKLTHVALYILMIGLPLSGWALVSSAPEPYNFPIHWFGLFDWPYLPVLSEIENKKEVSHSFAELHETLAAIMIVLLAMHVGAALKHHFINKDDVLTRMIPCLKKKDDK
jgi:cytochrome b561